MVPTRSDEESGLLAAPRILDDRHFYIPPGDGSADARRRSTESGIGTQLVMFPSDALAKRVLALLKRDGPLARLVVSVDDAPALSEVRRGGEVVLRTREMPSPVIAILRRSLTGTDCEFDVLRP